jgi:flagellar biosynthesis/type III secretory pathway M-ring protein FliF/YscJ
MLSLKIWDWAAVFAFGVVVLIVAVVVTVPLQLKMTGAEPEVVQMAWADEFGQNMADPNANAKSVLNEIGRTQSPPPRRIKLRITRPSCRSLATPSHHGRALDGRNLAAPSST